MLFAKALMTLVASVATAAAGTVTFRTLDTNSRDIIFTPNAGFPAIPTVKVGSSKETTVTFPEPWIGNFYAVKEGGPANAGMLGEVNFGGWLGKTYFDVSAIVDPSDHDNVKQMWPVSSKLPISGCEVFPCDNCYWLPDDIQTKVTDETDLITTLGSPSN